MSLYMCTYCAKGLSSCQTENDHIVPRSWPGAHMSRQNLTASCSDCNRAKGVNDPITWFFTLLRRDGAVPGRGETIHDIRATRLLSWWGDEIRTTAATVANLPLIIEAAQVAS